MARGKVYTEEDHKAAFEVFYETKNWKEIERRLGTAYQTAFQWAEATYACTHGCPWHGWAQLVDERDRAMQARLDLLEQGNYNVVEQDQAIRASLKGVPDKARRSNIFGLLKSDTERIAHWELLYGKVFFDLTGIALDYGSIKQIVAGEDGGLDIRQFYNAGKHINSLEGGIKTLDTIQMAIDKLKVRAGLVDEKGQSKNQEALEEEAEAASAKRAPLSLSELREMREMIKSTPPERLEAMATIIRSEDRVLEKLPDDASQ